jgi:hypothetical protein
MDPAEEHRSLFPPTFGTISEGSLTKPTCDGVNKENQGGKNGMMRCDGPRANGCGISAINAALRALRDVETIELALPLLPSGTKRVERASHAPSRGQNRSVGSGTANKKKMRMEKEHDSGVDKLWNDVASTPNNQNDHPRQRTLVTEDSSLLPSVVFLLCDEPHGMCWQMGDAKPISVTSFQQPTTTSNHSGLDKPAEGTAKVFDRKMRVPITPVKEAGPLNRFSGTTHVTPSPVNPPISARVENFSPVCSTYDQWFTPTPMTPKSLRTSSSQTPQRNPPLLSDTKKEKKVTVVIGHQKQPGDEEVISCSVLRSLPDMSYTEYSTHMTPRALAGIRSVPVAKCPTPTVSSKTRKEQKTTLVEGYHKQAGDEAFLCSVVKSPPGASASSVDCSTAMTPRAPARTRSLPTQDCTTPLFSGKTTETTMTIVKGHQKRAGDEEEFFCSVLTSPPGASSQSWATGLPLLQRAISLLDDMRIAGDVFHSQLEGEGEEDESSLLFGA